MSELLNFPFKNQLSEPIIDGTPDQNASMNCLPTSIASGMQYLLGKEFTGSEIEHQVYGSNYHGGTAAVNYVSWVSRQGVKMYAVSGASGYLVQQAHAQLAAAHPVICTIPSNWAIAPSNPMDPGPSHCVVFYKDAAGVLVAMNPWEAFAQAQGDAWWSARMCYGQIWILERGSMSGVPQGWKDDGETLTAPNGHRVVRGFRQWVLAHDWRSDDVPLNEEYGNGHGTQQEFLFERLTWSPQPGIQVQAYGQDYLQAVASAQALQAQVAALQAQLKAQPQVSADLKAALQTIQAFVQGAMK